MTKNTDKVDVFFEFLSGILSVLWALIRVGNDPERHKVPLWVRRVFLVTLPVSWPLTLALWIVVMLFAMIGAITIIFCEAFWFFLR
jgi:hypothetical protein